MMYNQEPYIDPIIGEGYIDPPMILKGNLSPIHNSDQMPAEYILNKIRYIESMNMPRLLVLKSGTGSGKSTAFPDYLFKNTDKTLLISVPLISISEELPQTFQQHLGYKIGENIGAINSQTNTLPEDKKKEQINFMTTKILQLDLESRSHRMKNHIIMVDEAHLFDTSTIMLFQTIKYTMEYNKFHPFYILMSASLDFEIYKKYFNLSMDNYVEVIGQSHEKDIFYMNISTQSFQQQIHMIFDRAIEHDQDIDADIIVFCSCKQEMNEVTKINPENYLYIEYTSMNVQDKSYQLQYKITTRLSDINAHMNKKYKRKIILCTNAAETGITMPHAKICVDTGFRKLVCYNPCQGMDIEISYFPINKSSQQQRLGRVGRNSKGTCYLMYDKYVSDNLSDKENYGLYEGEYYDLYCWKLLQKEELQDIDFIIKPNQDMELDHHIILTFAGYLNGNKLTDFGKQFYQCILKPLYVKFIFMMTSIFGVSVDQTLNIMTGFNMLTKDLKKYSMQEYNRSHDDIMILAHEYYEINKNIESFQDQKEYIRQELPELSQFHHNSLELNFMKMDHVKIIKICEYYSFAIWQYQLSTNNMYTNYKQIKVPYSAFEQNNTFLKESPKYIISYDMKNTFGAKYQQQFNSNLYSVMDGYVNICDDLLDSYVNDFFTLYTAKEYSGRDKLFMDHQELGKKTESIKDKLTIEQSMYTQEITQKTKVIKSAIKKSIKEFKQEGKGTDTDYEGDRRENDEIAGDGRENDKDIIDQLLYLQMSDGTE